LFRAGCEFGRSVSVAGLFGGDGPQPVTQIGPVTYRDRADAESRLI
jgi:hypothetical protein